MRIKFSSFNGASLLSVKRTDLLERIKKEEVTIYKVYALGKNSHIIKLVIKKGEELRDDKFLNSLISYSSVKEFDSHYNDSFSLRDANIFDVGLNHYNEHLCFYDIEMAKNYLQVCIKNKSYSPAITWDFTFDEPDYSEDEWFHSFDEPDYSE